MPTAARTDRNHFADAPLHPRRAPVRAQRPGPAAGAFPATLAAARAGADSAWATLYRDLAPAVTGYLRARGAPEPEDLAGEVFLQVVRDLHAFEGDEPDFRAWVFTIAHRRLLDDHRRRGRRPVQAAPAERLERAGPVGDGEADALDAVRSAEIRRALARLSPDQQSVLLLRILGGLTVEQVARATGKRPGAVKALQRRALKAIEPDLMAGA